MSKEILDMTCGPRSMHFDKSRSDVIYGDMHPRDVTKSQNQRVLVTPDVVFDFTALPFRDEQFDLVIFDPPHAAVLATSDTALQYGTLFGASWEDMIPAGLREAWRVVSPGGSVVFKWAEVKVKIRQVLDLVPEMPVLVGHRTSKTAIWVIFHKAREGTPS